MGQLDDLAGFVLFCFFVFLECSGSRSWSCGCPGVMPVLNLGIIICFIIIHNYYNFVQQVTMIFVHVRMKEGGVCKCESPSLAFHKLTVHNHAFIRPFYQMVTNACVQSCQQD